MKQYSFRIMSSRMFQCMVLAGLSSLLKLLFLPSYKSTDFAVHRNWLAITNKLPIQRWYFENTSEWTLDYPPFFAWFEYGLSRAARYFDDGTGLLDITSKDPDSLAALYFQRISVIVSDFVIFYATYKCCSTLSPMTQQGSSALSKEAKELFLMILVFFNAGLIMVDHIHFQYNGFLFGILFLSIYNILEGNILFGSFWFAALLNFKHLFLYMAPTYGIFLLRTYCLNAKKRGWSLLQSFSFKRLVALGFIVISIFMVSFGPFFNHIGQVMSRLFPFKRGLTHAFWAPNFWALYNTADKFLIVVGKCFGLFSINGTGASAFSKGLVEEAEHVVLPTVKPIVTLVLVVALILPCLVDLWFWPKSLSYKHLSNQFLRAIVLVSLTSFMFGWHVHEKAILIAILPLCILALRGSRRDAEIFVMLQAVGHYSLFPLLFEPFETVSKMCLVLLYSIISFSLFQKLTKTSLEKRFSLKLPLLSLIESLYVIGLVGCQLYVEIIHKFLPFAKNLEFLPLMLVSTYCALGVVWCWLKLYYSILSDQTGLPIEWNEKVKKRKIT